MSIVEPQPAVPKPSVRWYRLTPDRLVLGLLGVEGLLWLSDRLCWPVWHKGYAVLTAVAVVGVAMLLMLGWFAVALVFRWRFQFSIRSLLVLVVVIAVPCSWMAAEMKKAREQAEAINKLDAIVIYGDAGDSSATAAPPRGTVWLRTLLGNEFFYDAVRVDLNSDTRMDRLKELAQLHILILSGDDVTDAGLQHLEGLTQVRKLALVGTKVTNEGVKKLQRALPNCEIQK
jgi:hypothetical protein